MLEVKGESLWYLCRASGVVRCALCAVSLRACLHNGIDGENPANWVRRRAACACGEELTRRFRTNTPFGDYSRNVPCATLAVLVCVCVCVCAQKRRFGGESERGRAGWLAGYTDGAVGGAVAGTRTPRRRSTNQSHRRPRNAISRHPPPPSHHPSRFKTHRLSLSLSPATTTCDEMQKCADHDHDPSSHPSYLYAHTHDPRPARYNTIQSMPSKHNKKTLRNRAPPRAHPPSRDPARKSKAAATCTSLRSHSPSSRASKHRPLADTTDACMHTYKQKPGVRSSHRNHVSGAPCASIYSSIHPSIAFVAWRGVASDLDVDVD